MKILVVSAIWQRPQVENIFFLQLKKLQQQFAGVCAINVLIVGSEGTESRSRVVQHGFEYLEHPNQPLSNKWNAAVHFASMLEWDYMLLLGSDDLFAASAMEKYLEFARAGVDFVGLNDIYLFSMDTKQTKWWGGYQNDRRGEPAGAGRLLRRQLLHRMAFQPFAPGKKRGLDRSMTAKLRQLPHERVVVKGRGNGCILVDIKSGLNMVDWEKIRGVPRDSRKVMMKYFDGDILNLLYGSC